MTKIFDFFKEIIEAGSNITTPLGLIAFIAALSLIAFYFHSKRLEQENESVPEEDRGDFILQKKSPYRMKDDNLTKDQRFKLTNVVINQKLQKYKIIATVIIVISVLIAFIVIVINLDQKKRTVPFEIPDSVNETQEQALNLADWRKKSNQDLIERRGPFEIPDSVNEIQEQTFNLANWWKKSNQDLIERRGPFENSRYVTIWSQHFQKGRVIYNHVNGWVFIADGANKSIKKVNTSDALITTGTNHMVLETELLDDLFKGYEKDVETKIRSWVDSRLLRGGIGTIYIKHKLYEMLGKPRCEEYKEREVLITSGNQIKIIFGLQNRPCEPNKSCAISFDMKHNSYTKHTRTY